MGRRVETWQWAPIFKAPTGTYGVQNGGFMPLRAHEWVWARGFRDRCIIMQWLLYVRNSSAGTVPRRWERGGPPLDRPEEWVLPGDELGASTTRRGAGSRAVLNCDSRKYEYLIGHRCEICVKLGMVKRRVFVWSCQVAPRLARGRTGEPRRKPGCCKWCWVRGLREGETVSLVWQLSKIRTRRY